MSTLYAFDADEAGSEETNDVLTVGVAATFGAYFMIQRPLNKSDIGLDDIYVEYEDQIRGGYGILDGLELDRHFLRASLKDGTRIEASLALAASKWQELQADLCRALSQFPEIFSCGEE